MSDDCLLIHGTALKWGIRLQNFLGILKILVIVIIVISPLVNLKKVRENHNFSKPFEGTTGSAYGIVTALYNVIWSYVGYSNANYALSETKNPARTLKFAAPLALGIISVLYMLANVAYFAAVSKEEMLESKRLVAASLFRNMFGESAERALSVFVALSAFGNVLSVIYLPRAPTGPGTRARGCPPLLALLGRATAPSTPPPRRSL
ncbi:methionine permease [Metarhizium acridum]|nr:methionine permease [Metarhizium acridum]